MRPTSTTQCVWAQPSGIEKKYGPLHIFSDLYFSWALINKLDSFHIRCHAFSIYFYFKPYFDSISIDNIIWYDAIPQAHTHHTLYNTIKVIIICVTRGGSSFVYNVLKLYIIENSVERVGKKVHTFFSNDLRTCIHLFAETWHK